MSSNISMTQRIAEATRNLRSTSSHKSLASKVTKLTSDTLSNWGVFNAPSRTSGLGLESLQSNDFVRNSSYSSADADIDTFVNELDKLGVPSHQIAGVAEECIMTFDGTRKYGDIIRGAGSVSAENYAALSSVVGASSVASYASENFAFDSMAQEAFGQDLDRLSTDDRLTMSLVIMRPHDNIMDKGIARVPQASPEVTIRIPAPEVYDWAATQNSSSTVASRWTTSTYPMRDLYRNPTPINTANKKVTAIRANDSRSVLFDNASLDYYKTGVDVSLLDLSRNSAVVSYATADRTDIIAEGGNVTNLLVTITMTIASTPTTETFLVSTNVFENARFVMSPNGLAAQRQASFPAAFVITSTTTKYDGNASLIAAALTDAKVQVDVRANGIVSLQTGVLQLSGSVNLTLLQLANGTAIGGTTNTMFGTAVASLSGYSVGLYFDEENQRKANLAVFMQYSQKVFTVPRSRVIFTEYALAQDVDDNALSATSSFLALGNGRRGLDTIVNSINDIAVGQTYAAANPELASLNKVNEQSLASSLVKPFTASTVIDFATTTINTLNESTRLSEMHGYFRARFLVAVSNLLSKSLMSVQYKAGEKPVLKAWVHRSILDLVVGIPDYHPALDDEAKISTGADYSFTLPNGVRVDVIASSFDCLQNRLYAIPVIESDMTSVITAASIRDCGTVTTNYSPTNAGSVTRRIATTTREIVMVSNRVGIAMEIKNFQSQLGTVGSASVALNSDTVSSLT